MCKKTPLKRNIGNTLINSKAVGVITKGKTIMCVFMCLLSSGKGTNQSVSSNGV